MPRRIPIITLLWLWLPIIRTRFSLPSVSISKVNNSFIFLLLYFSKSLIQAARYPTPVREPCWWTPSTPRCCAGSPTWGPSRCCSSRTPARRAASVSAVTWSAWCSPGGGTWWGARSSSGRATSAWPVRSSWPAAGPLCCSSPRTWLTAAAASLWRSPSSALGVVQEAWLYLGVCPEVTVQFPTVTSANTADWFTKLANLDLAQQFMNKYNFRKIKIKTKQIIIDPGFISTPWHLVSESVSVPVLRSWWTVQCSGPLLCPY